MFPGRFFAHGPGAALHSQADHAQLTGKVFAPFEIELGDIRLLEYFDIP